MNHSLSQYRSTYTYKSSLRKRLVSSRTVIPAIFIGLIIVFACLQIWQRVYVLGLVKDISTMEKEKATLNDLIKKTNTDIVDLSRLTRIEEIAVRDLGMSRTSTENLFTLKVKKIEQKQDALTNVMTSLKKLADNLPVINETKADTINLFETNGH